MLRCQLGDMLRNPPGQQHGCGRTQAHDSDGEECERHEIHLMLRSLSDWMTQSYAASRKKSSILYVVYQIQLFSNCNSLNVARRTRNRDGWPSQPILCFFYPLRTVLLEAFVSTETASNA